jgi:hypothetical protein
VKLAAHQKAKSGAEGNTCIEAVQEKKNVKDTIRTYVRASN